MTHTSWRHIGRVALLVAAFATIGCDRVTKHAATTWLAGAADRSYLADTVRLTYAENAGGFLSLGATLPPAIRTALFSVGTGIALVLLLVRAVRRSTNGLGSVGATLFVAGGLSNWADRMVHGRVVDFLNVGVGPVRTGIFNVADVAIMLGVGLIIVAEFVKAGARTTETPTGE